MKDRLTKLKAALTIGSIWGAAFAAVGAALGALLPSTSFLGTALGLGIAAGTGGLVLGVGFAGLLAVMESRRSLVELTPRRGALWGFIAGSLVALVGSMLLGSLFGVVGLTEDLLGLTVPISLQIAAVLAGTASYGAISAGLASTTVSLAKRAPGELADGPDGSDQQLVGGGPADAPDSRAHRSTT